MDLTEKAYPLLVGLKTVVHPVYSSDFLLLDIKDTVYAIIVDKNIYIGRTYESLKKRLAGHVSALIRGVHDNLGLQTLFNIEPESLMFLSLPYKTNDLDIDEGEYIKLFRKLGYNVLSHKNHYL